jgi:hypothetical protein
MTDVNYLEADEALFSLAEMYEQGRRDPELVGSPDRIGPSAGRAPQHDPRGDHHVGPERGPRATYGPRDDEVWARAAAVPGRGRLASTPPGRPVRPEAPEDGIRPREAVRLQRPQIRPSKQCELVDLSCSATDAAGRDRSNRPVGWPHRILGTGLTLDRPRQERFGRRCGGSACRPLP